MPSSGDGVSNAERAYFVADVFDVQTIDLSQTMPFETALVSDDAEGIEAAIHYAKLQFQFVHACGFAGLFSEPFVELQSAALQVSIRKLAWHLRHVEQGRPTPPLPFH